VGPGLGEEVKLREGEVEGVSVGERRDGEIERVGEWMGLETLVFVCKGPIEVDWGDWVGRGDEEEKPFGRMELEAGSWGEWEEVVGGGGVDFREEVEG
jgi:hypothetical protein